jgi:hypothetical protein
LKVSIPLAMAGAAVFDGSPLDALENVRAAYDAYSESDGQDFNAFTKQPSSHSCSPKSATGCCRNCVGARTSVVRLARRPSLRSLDYDAQTEWMADGRFDPPHGHGARCHIDGARAAWC